MKKRVFLKILVALAVLTSVLLTSVLGVSKAEYFKEFMSGALSVEMDPDLMLSYYLYDYNGTGSDATSKTLAPEYGAYRSLKNFSQEIVVGRDKIHEDVKGSTEEWNDTSTTNNPNKDPEYYVKYNGENIIYQIKLPVDETGYYVLDFTVDITKKDKNQDDEAFSQNYDRAIGCEILNVSDGYGFGDNTRLDLYTRSGNDTVYATSHLFPDGNAKAKNKRLESDGAYQWKTLSPSRMEHVKLAFKVEEADVKEGYVLWMWDFAGLYGAKTYIFEFTDVSIEKTMDLPNPTTGKLNTDKPYFMFPQTDLINNQIINGYGDGGTLGDYKTSAANRTMNYKGQTSYSKGRGAFVTEATTNSLQLQAEALAYAYSNDKKKLLDISDSDTYSNPIGFYVPIKNIQADKTYKVTFDFSIARQGTPAANLHGGLFTDETFANYADFGDILKTGTNLFSSYISYVPSGSSIDSYTNRQVGDHKNNETGGMAQIQYNDKSYNGAGVPLTKYDDVTRNSLNYFTTQNSVNDTYSTIGEASIPSTIQRAETRNWYNAVLHTEYNGQNKINWMTFYNTTFSFNIPSTEGANFDSLYWTWAINSVVLTGYYRIRIDNVRIQEVVQYSSSLNRDGVSIAGTDIVPPVHHAENYGDNAGIFSGFRGRNGTGQNYQAKGAILDKSKQILTDDKTENDSDVTAADRKSQVFLTEGNIYAPIVDASRYTAAPGNGKDYLIELDGSAVCVGGIDRYVFSVDGGLTWEDMTLTGANTTSTMAGSSELNVASRGVNQHASGTTRYSSADFANTNFYTGTREYNYFVHLDVEGGVFGENDAKNGSFAGGKLSVDMSKYKHQANLDIIIAAVPASNTSLRCEIVRIINYNPIRNYYTQAKNVISDITVTNPTMGTASLLNGYYFIDPNATNATNNMNQSVYENTESFSYMKGIRLSTSEPSNQISSYSRGTAHSYAYEDTRTLFLDIPVYTQLSITGFAFVEKGNTVSITETKASDGTTITKRTLKETAISGESIESYAWSADGGRTWNPCSGTTGETSLNTETEITSGTLDVDIKNRAAAWVSNSKYSGKTYTAIKEMAQAYESYAADNFSKAIRANLSQYAGKTVDVIFAAKPKGSDVYCPIAKVDNVAVCGAAKTFYTEIESVQIVKNSTTTTITPAYSDRSNKPLDKLTKNIVGSNIGWWDLDYAKAADADADFIYTSYEAYNTNIYQTRLYNYEENPINGGSTIKITGATVAAGLTTRVKYSFDGGLTWSTITKGTEAATSTIINKAKKCDNSLTSGTNGGYTTTPLSIPVPSNISGQARNLLVVIEGNGISYPILSVRLLFPKLS